jgi:hypothetical protein
MNEQAIPPGGIALTKMNKYHIKPIVKFTILISCEIFFSCMGSPSVQQPPVQAATSSETALKRSPNGSEKVFWNTSTSGGDLIIVGIGGIYMYDSESIQKALEDAARKVSLFTGLRGATVYYEHIGASFWDYVVADSTKIEYNENYHGYIDQLEYDPDRDIIINERGAFVRVRYKHSNPLHVAYPSSGSETEKPEWIINPPASISGFIAGVGYGPPQMYPNRAYVVSYETAIANLISRGATNIEGKNLQYQSEGYNYEDIRENTITARAVISGFYVLQVWVDPNDGGVYSLVIAQSVKGL